jgi:hypothetical protein
MEGGGGGHLLPPPVPLGALPRPPADCGFSPVLWDPADPMKHQYKRMPPLPMVRRASVLCSSDTRVHNLLASFGLISLWLGAQVSTGLTLTASSSHPTEPPSNQIYGGSGSRSSAAPAEEDRVRTIHSSRITSFHEVAIKKRTYTTNYDAIVANEVLLIWRECRIGPGPSCSRA